MSSTTRYILSVFPRFSFRYHKSTGLYIPLKDRVFEHRNPSHISGYRYIRNYVTSQKHNILRRNFSVYNNVQHGAGAPLPSQPPSSSSPWNWILGVVLAIVLPFTSSRLGPLLQFKNEVDTTVETIEEVIEVVETVAEVVDKAAEKISENLPEDGKLKKFVEIVENVAEETVKDAHLVEDAIDEFQEIEGKVENIVETLTDVKDGEHKHKNEK